MKDLIKLLSIGAILNTEVTVKDAIRRAQHIYGPSIPALKGKTKILQARGIKVKHIPRLIFAPLVLHVGTFFVQGEPYLLSVSTPLGLTMVQPLGPSPTGATLLAALKHQLSAYKVGNFSVTYILTDGDSGLRKVADEILALGVRLDATGVGEHVPTVEAKIRVVKERTRAVRPGLGSLQAAVVPA